jgi:fatty-acyl-CoA synthase
MTSVLETTLGRLVDDLAVRQPDRTAMRDLISGESLTFLEFAGASDRVARGLAAVGFKPGDHLALWGGSCINWILAQYAAAKIGLVVVSADPDYNDDQMAYLLEQSDVKGLIIFGGYKDRDFTEIVQRICPEIDREPHGQVGFARFPLLSHLIYSPTPGMEGKVPKGFIAWPDLIDRAFETPTSELDALKAAIRPDDVTLISYTSGTTGAPKGVMCTHHGLVNKSYLAASVQNLGPDDITGLIVPLYHMFGNTCAVLTGLTRGAGLVLTGQWFEPGQALECLSQGGCTVIYGAPSQFIALMEHPDYPNRDLSGLRTGIMGGAPCPMEVMKKVVHDMGVSGILVGYGQTEASSWVTLTRPDDPLEVRVSTIGRALDHTEVRIVDPGTGAETPLGESGEMCTRGFLMAGYYRMPAATSGAIDADGWLHTGDMVAMDPDGNCRVMGRLTDLINVNGVQVSPVDVEEALFGRPGVAEVSAFGVKQGDGEIVAVWIRPLDRQKITADEIFEFCTSRLVPQAVPSVIHFTDSFPMTATGKIQKFKMREQTIKMMEKGTVWQK